MSKKNKKHAEPTNNMTDADKLADMFDIVCEMEKKLELAMQLADIMSGRKQKT